MSETKPAKPKKKTWLYVFYGLLTVGILFFILSMNDLGVFQNYVEKNGVTLACGVVPIISDSPKSATKYYAPDEKSLFKCNDAKDLAAKIDWWIEHPKEKEEYSAKYAKISKEKFDHAACMQAMEDMLLKTASVKKA